MLRQDVNTVIAGFKLLTGITVDSLLHHFSFSLIRCNFGLFEDTVPTVKLYTVEWDMEIMNQWMTEDFVRKLPSLEALWTT